jgi:hypothetical protein
MAYTAFGADKAAGGTISAADMNTYLRDNLIALKAHNDDTAAVHGLHASTYMAGAAYSARRLEGMRSAETGGGGGDYDVTFSFGTTYTNVFAIIHSIEGVVEGGFLLNGRITSRSNSGCTVRVHSDDDDGSYKHFRVHVVVYGEKT